MGPLSAIAEFGYAGSCHFHRNIETMSPNIWLTPMTWEHLPSPPQKNCFIYLVLCPSKLAEICAIVKCWKATAEKALHSCSWGRKMCMEFSLQSKMNHCSAANQLIERWTKMRHALASGLLGLVWLKAWRFIFCCVKKSSDPNMFIGNFKLCLRGVQHFTWSSSRGLSPTHLPD